MASSGPPLTVAASEGTAVAGSRTAADVPLRVGPSGFTRPVFGGAPRTFPRMGERVFSGVTAGSSLIAASLTICGLDLGLVARAVAIW